MVGKIASPEAAVLQELRVQYDDTSSSKHGCGIGSYRPTWLQTVHSSRTLLLFLSICAFVQGMVVNGLMPKSLQVLEKRLHLTNLQSGFLDSMYDAACAIFLLPVAYFGEKGNKGKWLGYGVLIMGMGSVLCASAQFVMDEYKIGEESNYICERRTELTVDRLSNVCSEDGDGGASLRWAKFLLMSGHFLHGVGATPLYTLGYTYLDENVAQSSSPVYFAVFHGVSIVGPAFGFMLGGSLAKIYGDVDKVDAAKVTITSDDPRWYGAWWLGFILSGALAICGAFPLLCFSKHFKDSKELRKADIDETHDRNFKYDPQPRSICEVPRHLKYLLTNWPWLALCLRKVSESFLVNGYGSFLGKVLEKFYFYPPASSSIITGAMIIPGGLFGNLLAGIILTKTRMKCKQMMFWTTIFHAICFLCLFGMLVHCPNAKFAGVNAPTFHQKIGDIGFNDSCNAPCSCVEDFNPICYQPASLIYFSPCYAGCQSKLPSQDDQVRNSSVSSKFYYNVRLIIPPESAAFDFPITFTVWTNCSCLPDPFTAKGGFCTEKCNIAPIFIVTISVLIFFTFMGSLTSTVMELRCVHFNDRTMAISLSWLMARVFGALPAPSIFGLVMDKACLYTQKVCNDAFECLHYDNKTMATGIVTIGSIIQFVTIIILISGYIKYQPVADVENERGPSPIVKTTAKVTDPSTLPKLPSDKIATKEVKTLEKRGKIAATKLSQN